MTVLLRAIASRGAAALLWLGLFFSLTLSPAGASPLTDMTAYWDFNETSGTTAANSGSAGSALNGALVGGADIEFAPGLFGNAVWLGGSDIANPSVDVAGAVISGGQTAYTISMWFNPASGYTRRQVFFESDVVGTYGVSAGLTETDNEVQHFINNASDQSRSSTTTFTPTKDQWHHLAITYASGTSRIYINGVEYPNQISSGGSVRSTTDFHIGRHRSLRNCFSFNGLIDDMAVWDGRTLTGYEVHAIHRMGLAGYALDSDITVHVKADNMTNLNQAGSWEPAIAPGASSYLVFDATFDQAAALDMGGALSVAGLRVIDGNELIDIDNGSGDYLQIGAAGIDMTTATRDLTVANLTLGAGQSWDIAADRTLTVGSLSGNHALTKTGAGTLAITGTGSPIGGTTITGGTLQIGNSDFSGDGGLLTTTSLDNGHGGTLALYKGVLTIDGGTFTPVQSGEFRVQSSGDETTMVVNLNNGASTAIGGDLRFHGGSTLELNSSTATVGGNIIIGSISGSGGSAGKILVAGAGASLTGSGIVGVGGSGRTGYLDVSDGAQIVLIGSGKFGIADSVADNSKGYVTVESGGSISVSGDVNIGSTNLSGQKAELTITGAGSSFQKIGSGATTIGGTSQSDGKVVIVEDGSMAVGGDGITVNQRGTLQIGKSDFTGPGSLTTTSLDASASGATFSFYAGTVTIDGGGFKPASGDYILEPGGIDTAVINLQDGAEMEVDGFLRLQVGSTLNVIDSTANVSGFIGVGSRTSRAGEGRMVVDGAAAIVTTSDRMWVGGAGRTGRVTVRNGGSIGLADSLHLVDSAQASTQGYVNIESGGSITVGTDIAIGARDGSDQKVELTITGANSTVTQVGSGSVTLGGATGSSDGKLVIKDGGSMSAGTGGIVVNAGGTLQIGESDFTGPGSLTTTSLDASAPGAVFNFYAGTVTINGGPLKLPSDDYILEPGGADTAVINLQDGAEMEVSGFLRLQVGSTLNVTDSTGNVTGFIGVGSRTSALGRTGEGQMAVDGAAAIVTTSDRMWVGGAGQTGRVTVRNGGSIVIAGSSTASSLGVADSSDNSTQGYFDVESGGSITIGSGDILIGTRGRSGQYAQMTVDGSGSAVTQNGSGSLQIGAAGGSTGLLTIAGGTFTTGAGGTFIAATGALELQGGTFNTPSLDDSHGKLSFTGGRLEVQDFTGNLLNAGGVYAPGLSPAISSITGDYTQDVSATIEMELGGTVLGDEYDHLDIFGFATLDGTLRVVLTDSFEPAAGDTFDLFDYHGGVSGDFAIYDLPALASNIWWDHSLMSTTGVLRVIPEPGTFVILAMGLLGLLSFRQRRRPGI